MKRRHLVLIISLSTVVLLGVIALYMRSVNDSRYYTTLLRWSQEIENSSLRLDNAVTPSSVDRIAIEQEYDTIVALELEVNTSNPPDKYKQSRDRLAGTLHSYRLALYSFKTGDFQSAQKYLGLAVNSFENFALTLK